MKSNPSRFWGQFRVHKLLDGFDQDQDLVFVIRQVSLNLRDPAGKLLVSSNGFPQSNKGSDDENTHLYRSAGAEHTGSHDGPMLREPVRIHGRKLEILKMVTICQYAFSVRKARRRRLKACATIKKIRELKPVAQASCLCESPNPYRCYPDWR